MWKGAGGGSFVEDVDSDRVEGDGLSQSLFSGGLDVVRNVVECRSGSGQFVGFIVKVLRHNSDAALVDTFFPEVASHLFDSENIEAKMDRAMDAGPQVSLLALGRWLVTLQEPSESVVDGLVVDKDVDWAFRRGNEVNKGQGLSSLGGLREAMHLAAVVETVPVVVIDAKASSSEKGVRLVGARTVGGGVDPV